MRSVLLCEVANRQMSGKHNLLGGGNIITTDFNTNRPSSSISRHVTVDLLQCSVYVHSVDAV